MPSFQDTVAANTDNKGLSAANRPFRYIAGLVLLLAAIFGIYAFLHREPHYEGKALSEWVDELDTQYEWRREPAEKAIRQIGPKAVPYLLEWLKEPQYSPIWTRVDDWLSDHSEVRLHLPEKKNRQFGAVTAFKILGPVAKVALPDLEKMLQEGDGSSGCAARAFAGIGPDSLPILTNALASTNRSARRGALYALGLLGEKAAAAAPLVEALSHGTDEYEVRTSLVVLGQLGEAAMPYVPELRQIMRTNYDDGEVAAYVLGKIGKTLELLRALTNEPPPARWTCLRALHCLSLASRHKRISDENFFEADHVFFNLRLPPIVRTNMLQQWGRVAIPILTNYLVAKDATARAQAADDLGTFGAAGYRAEPALSNALTDTNELVRHSAAEALKKIDVQLVEGGIVRGRRNSKNIALEFTGHAFAEGGEKILDELAKHHAKASFFLTGDFLSNPKFKPTVERIIKEGHYLGPHSDKHLLYCPWDNRNATLVSQSDFSSDLNANRTKIRIIQGREQRIQFWLPAYEWYNQQIVDWSAQLRLTLVNFTPGTRSNADYTQEGDKNFVSSQAIFDSIVKKEHEDPDGLNGFLLLMHLGAGPGRKDKMHARFGELLDYLSTKGYQFVRIDEMLGERLIPDLQAVEKGGEK